MPDGRFGALQRVGALGAFELHLQIRLLTGRGAVMERRMDEYDFERWLPNTMPEIVRRIGESMGIESKQLMLYSPTELTAIARRAALSLEALCQQAPEHQRAWRKDLPRGVRYGWRDAFALVVGRPIEEVAA